MENGIIKSLEEKILKYKEEIRQIETAIEVIKKNTDFGSIPKSERKLKNEKEKAGSLGRKSVQVSKKPISKQVIDYLHESNRFLFPSEIVNELSVRSGKKAESVKLLVNQTLSRLKKETKLVSYKPEKSRSHAWGFQNWLNENSLPQISHSPSSAE